MKERIKPLGVYNYTVVLTYIGMLVGLFGVMNVMTGDYHRAMLCLMIAGICDMFDGAIASTKKDRTRDEKTFGIQIDSLSDLICFGVLPATFVYIMNVERPWAFAVSGLFVLCGLIRLAYYNVDEANRQAATAGPRECYTGLPITASALLIPAVYVVCTYYKLELDIVALVSLLVIGVCYVTPFKLKKPHILGKIAVVALGGIEFLLLLFNVVG